MDRPSSESSGMGRRGFLGLGGAAALERSLLSRDGEWRRHGFLMSMASAAETSGSGAGSSGGLPPLKITDVRVIVTCPDRNYVVVKISTTEAGLYGVGDATLNGRELAVAEDLKQHIAPLLIGRDPEQIEGTYGTAGAKPAEAAAGRVANMALLPQTEVFEPAPYLSTVPRLFEHLRAKLGQEVELLHDCHEKLDPIQAARLARDLEPYHLFFLEDCLRPEYKESFRLIREHSTTPLAMGELFNSLWDCVPLIKEQLIDYIRCDLGHLGGITAARKIATLAELFQVRTAWHGPGDIGPPTHAANVHVGVSIQNFGIHEMVLFSYITWL